LSTLPAQSGFDESAVTGRFAARVTGFVPLPMFLVAGGAPEPPVLWTWALLDAVAFTEHEP
jgi:hypothetical protein